MANTLLAGAAHSEGRALGWAAGNDRMARQKRYTDEFRASAVVMLESQGYPEQAGALTAVSRHLGVPLRTLSRWYNKEQNPPPDSLVNEKKGELVNRLSDLLEVFVEEMFSATKDATLQQLATAFGIVMDKRELLLGKPTSRSQVDMAVSDLVDISDDELDTLLEHIARDNAQRRHPGDSL